METGRLPLHVEAAARALKFERRAADSTNSLLRDALVEFKRHSKERSKFFEKIKWNNSTEAENPMRNQLAAEVHRLGAIRTIKGEIMGTFYERRSPITTPAYLIGGADTRFIARVRCGNEEKGRDTWRKYQDQQCRICGTEEETLEHWATTCHPTEMDEEEMWTEKGREWLSG